MHLKSWLYCLLCPSQSLKWYDLIQCLLGKGELGVRQLSATCLDMRMADVSACDGSGWPTFRHAMFLDEVGDINGCPVDTVVGVDMVVGWRHGGLV